MSSLRNAYLPSLLDCLNLSAPILSWNDAFSQLDGTCPPGDDKELLTFLKSPDTLALLREPLPQFTPPSAESQTAFQKATAARHTASSHDWTTDIEQIKQDALWLSKEANVNELDSLRIVILEWQSRPQFQLAKSFSDSERASLQDVLHVYWNDVEHTFSESTTLPPSFEQSASEQCRHSRILSVYFTEATALLGIYARLMQISLSKVTEPILPTEIISRNSYLEEITLISREVCNEDMPQARVLHHIEQCIAVLSAILEELESDLVCSVDIDYQDYVRQNWANAIFHRATILMEVVAACALHSKSLLPGQIVLSWFQLMNRCGFFAAFPNVRGLSSDVVDRLQTTTTIVSLTILKPKSAVDLILLEYDVDKDELPPDRNSIYFLDTDIARCIHDILISATVLQSATAILAIAAWGLIVYAVKDVATFMKDQRESRHVAKLPDNVAFSEPQNARRSSGSSSASIQQSMYEDVVDVITHQFEDDGLLEPLHYALEGDRVFSTISLVSSVMRQQPLAMTGAYLFSLQDLIKIILPLAKYSGELVTAQIDLLRASPTARPTELAQHRLAFETSNIASKFLDDEYLRTHIYDVSASRFPFETLPMLQLSLSLINALTPIDPQLRGIERRLHSFQGYAQPAKGQFGSFRTVREDENLNSVQLLIDVPTQAGSFFHSQLGDLSDQISALVIPHGTDGTVISDSQPAIVLWHHKYSALALFGTWLNMHKFGKLDQSLFTNDVIQDIIGQVLHLLNAMFSKIIQNHSLDHALDLLEETESDLDNDEDLISIVLDIIEIESTNFRSTQSELSCEIMLGCVQFMDVICTIAPNRIRSVLAAGRLFGDTEKESAVLAMSSSTIGLSFAEAYARFYRSLIRISISRPQEVRNRLKSAQKPISNTIAPNDLTQGQLSIVTESLCLSTFRIVEANLKYSVEQRRVLGLCMAVFDEVINIVVGIGAGSTLYNDVRAVLRPSAEFILQSYSPSSVATEATPPIQILCAGLIDSIQRPLPYSASDQQSFHGVLRLCTALLTASNLGTCERAKIGRFYLGLLPIFIRYISFGIIVRPMALELVQKILEVAETESLECSVLARLGTNQSTRLCEILQAAASLYHDEQSTTAAWTLMSNLLSKSQQWVAIMLLTGSCPLSLPKSIPDCARERTLNLHGGSLLVKALQKLSDLESVNMRTSVSILDFVVAAQQNWTWAVSKLRDDSDFFTSLFNNICGASLDNLGILPQCYKLQLACRATQLATTYLHQARTTQDVEMTKRILPFIHWLTENAIETTGYNASLHSNLDRNFASRYAPYTLYSFKRTANSNESFGRSYFYDTKLVDDVLFSSGDGETSRSHNQSFAAELVRANLNLSLVQCHIDMFQGFQTLLVEHCALLGQHNETQKNMARITRRCLEANTRPLPARAIFDDLRRRRFDLALALIRSLVVAQARGLNSLSLLETVWTCLQSTTPSYESAALEDKLPLLRSGISILTLVLQLRVQKAKRERNTDPASKSTKPVSGAAIAITLDIVEKIVVRGMVTIVRSLGEQDPGSQRLFDSDRSVNAYDVELILSVLRSVLQLRFMPDSSQQLSSRLSSLDMIHACLSLYSWSHTLLGSRNAAELDFTYADLSIRFLVLMSSLRDVAEQLAIEGVLTRLSTSRVTNLLRSKSGGISHYETHTALQTLYRVWTYGLLPLCLNLLDRVGRAMSAEVSVFLNQFPHQLQRSSNAFAGSKVTNNLVTISVTFELASEAATLALISRLLNDYRQAGASTGVDATEIVSLTYYEAHRKDLVQDVEDLLDNNQRLLQPRLLAATDIDIIWNNTLTNDIRSRSLLEEKVTQQLRTVVACLDFYDSD